MTEKGRRRILILEDEIDWGQALKTTFGRLLLGWDVYLVNNGTSAIDFLEQLQVDLLSLDFALGKGDRVKPETVLEVAHEFGCRGVLLTTGVVTRKGVPRKMFPSVCAVADELFPGRHKYLAKKQLRQNDDGELEASFYGKIAAQELEELAAQDAAQGDHNWGNVFRRSGNGWALGMSCEPVFLKHLEGLQSLWQMLCEKGTPVSVLPWVPTGDMVDTENGEVGPVDQPTATATTQQAATADDFFSRTRRTGEGRGRRAKAKSTTSEEADRLRAEIKQANLVGWKRYVRGVVASTSAIRKTLDEQCDELEEASGAALDPMDLELVRKGVRFISANLAEAERELTDRLEKALAARAQNLNEFGLLAFVKTNHKKAANDLKSMAAMLERAEGSEACKSIVDRLLDCAWHLGTGERSAAAGSSALNEQVRDKRRDREGGTKEDKRYENARKNFDNNIKKAYHAMLECSLTEREFASMPKDVRGMRAHLQARARDAGRLPGLAPMVLHLLETVQKHTNYLRFYDDTSGMVWETEQPRE